jgi:flagellar basal body-associated protein FliL
MFCPKCGKQIKDDDIFCAYCGESITPGAPAPANPGPAQQTPYTPPNQVPPTPNNYNYPQQPNVFAKSGGKKNGGMIAIIVTLSVLLAAAVGGVIFLLAKNSGDDSSSDKASESENAVVTSDTTEAETTAVTEETTSETEPTTKSTATTERTTTTTETTTVTETTTETATEPETAISADSAAKAEAAAYSTNDRPTFAEFDWCAGQFGLVTAPPPNAEVIDNYYATGGGWKSMIVYEDTTGAGPTREIDNIEIFFDGNRVTLTVDWYYVEPPYSEAYYMDEGTVTQFTGAVNGNVIHTAADVNGSTVTIDLHSFWRADGKQYALGTLYLSDGSTNYLALVRK